MNSESPQIKVKSCNSRKRQLPNYFFGIRKFSADGYNPCCKHCRNFRKRKAYHGVIDPTDSVLPLADHNRQFLVALKETPVNTRLLGLDLKSLNAIKITFKTKGRNKYLLTLKTMDEQEYTFIHLGKNIEFIEVITLLLNRLNIRLFHPHDFIGLSNWGLSKPN